MKKMTGFEWVLMVAMVGFLGHLAAQAAPGDHAQQIEYYKKQRDLALYTVCKANLKNIGTALEMWSTDNQGRFPARLSQVMPNYLRAIPTCAAAGVDTYSASYRAADKRFAVMCQGNYHASAGIPANYPRCDSAHGLIAPPSPIRPAHRASTLVGCKSNLKNIGTGLEMWGTDHGGHFPTRLQEIAPTYLRQIPPCPAANRDTYSASYEMRRNPEFYAIACKGSYHKDEGYPANCPRYNSNQGLQDR